MKEFLNWLKETLPLLIAFWGGKLSSKSKSDKQKEKEDEALKKDVTFADNTSDDEFIKLLNEKFK